MNVSLGKCARWIPANGGNKHNTAMEATKVKGSIVPYTEKPGSWSSAGCRKITESESDVINKEMFHFSQLGYFGIKCMHFSNANYYEHCDVSGPQSPATPSNSDYCIQHDNIHRSYSFLTMPRCLSANLYSN